MQKLVRLTTHDLSLNVLLKGQLRYLNHYFDVVAVAHDTGQLALVAEREGVRTVAIKMKREISLLQDLKSLWALIRFFRKEKPHILHCNTPKGSLLALAAGKLCRVPHRLYTVTGLRYQGTTGNFRRLLMGMERLSCAFATKVIPEGEGVKRALIVDKITKKPLSVVHNGNINGIDTAYFSQAALSLSKADQRARLGFADEDTVFVFVGRIVNDKGMTELAHAMQRLPSPVKLILVGPKESQLDALPDDVQHYFDTSDRVLAVGFQADVRPYLSAADALVFPSYREGFPNVVMQAGAMGLPSIVTDIMGSNEIIRHEENGLIVPPRDADALYRAMLRFFEKPLERDEMAKKARPLIVERYRQRDLWDAMRKMYEALD